MCGWTSAAIRSSCARRWSTCRACPATEAGAGRRAGAGAARAGPAPGGAAIRRRGAGPHRARAGSAGCCSPATWTPSRSPTTCPAAASGHLLYGCGTSRHEGRRRRHRCTSRRPCRSPRYDLTLVFYDCEEVEADRNGLGRIEREHADWLRRRPGRARRADERRASRPAARARCGWRSPPAGGGRTRPGPGWATNAVHAAGAGAGPARAATRPGRSTIDGCRYREGLQAVRIAGGVAGNVVPDVCVVTVNFRFAPGPATSRRREQHVREVFDGFELAVTDAAPGALPGLAAPAAARVPGRHRRAAGAPSTAGPTSPGSPRSASRRSTSAPATRTWRTPGRSTSTSGRSPPPPTCCAAS